MHKSSNKGIPNEVEYTTVNTEDIKNNENHNKESEQTQSLCKRIAKTAKQVIRKTAPFIFILYIILATGLLVLFIMERRDSLSITGYKIFDTILDFTGILPKENIDYMERAFKLMNVLT
ncbi:hypothetical protein NEPAR06_2052 [Nematocida parisii]|uniref:Uncharacterized protein n=1 Tax=Nematocida parisii (strain ERTm3) TaxID=935791 RepID=I3EDJ2_NEMP3|nr:uncharacterized protein NEPG_01503 [Nematocida parisii ERTm1]EIJ87289.1 hypothetical protein NEQG_02412 [Nematocida parisii ERTm3]KAI5129575.1 hypothetical protein NEPAR03_1738 [Nematocida parisii]EIJ93931.1 hypothetical protein NEPG_01503 [Nematocida parisii ERTm1]KAI5130654.1 hypothetical protein NEPAR08_2163 [Nematocida parisii]KAI5143838.1 hypothetical protein NEPAR07_0887 [Nematocida parisii]|eukprot:XP_013059331.1 hypothetical protein NEPG_01503 [Nematocida parisii ERTm1]